MYNKTKLVIHFADSVCAKEFALNLSNCVKLICDLWLKKFTSFGTKLLW